MIWIACPDLLGMERAGEQERKMGIIQMVRMLSEQQNNKPLEIKDQEMFDKMLECIHMNLVMAGFVTKRKIGSISSARDFSGMKGQIELNFS